MSLPRTNTLEVEVRDFENRILDRAWVVLRSMKEDGAQRTLRFDPNRAAYVAFDVAPGGYELTASGDDLEAQTRCVRVAASGHREVFVLGPDDPPMDYYYRGNVKVPYSQLPWVAVTFDPGVVTEAEVGDWKRQWDKPFVLEKTYEVPDDEAVLGKDEPEIHERHTILVSVDDATRDEVVSTALGTDGVLRAGPVISVGAGSVSFLTDELVVRFKENVSEQDARHVLGNQKPGFEVLRKIPYVPNGFHVKWQAIPSYDLLRVACELTLAESVEWAEPNLAGAARWDDPGLAGTGLAGQDLWDRKLVNTWEAWKRLEGSGKNPGGDPNVVIAVVDTGVQSSHPAFQVKLSNGEDKIYKSFDFRRMEDNNDLLFENRSHGTKVAGIAAAADAGNGVVGVAPNCRVMGLIYPATELETLDMYYWAAGLDPHSPLTGFPEPLERGADVFVTCVGFGFSAGIPISGAASRMIDVLASDGRGGKGCLFFCSAGNDDDWCRAVRAWAVHDKAFGVAASTLESDGKTELRASYSNFGSIELCAPTSGGASSTRSTTTIQEGIYGEFGGTSSATPLAAGAAALVLSARPELSWDEVRTILRSTALPIEVGNSDAIGQWLDADYGPSRETGKEPVYSFWYGYGRLDVARAVESALAYPKNLVVEPEIPAVRVASSDRGLLQDELGDLLRGMFFFLAVFHAVVALLVLGAVPGDWPARLFAAIFAFNLFLGTFLSWWLKKKKKKDDFHEEDPEVPKNPPP